jgi:O-antigen/teichoic acid export membrane protein
MAPPARAATMKLRSLLNWPTITTIGSRGLTLLLAFGASIVVGRHLGPSGQGSYAVAITFAGTVAQLTNLGLHTTNTYRLAEDSSLRAPLLAISVWVAVAFGGGIAIAVGLGYLALGSVDAKLIWLAVAQVPGRVFWILGSSLLVALHRVTAMNLLQTATYAALFLGAYALSGTGAGVMSFVSVTTVVWTVVAILFWWQLRARGDDLRFDRRLFREILPYSFKSYVICLFTYLVSRTNIFMLEWIIDKPTVGHYSVAAQFGDAIGLMPTSVALLLLPRLLRGESRQRWVATSKAMLEVAAVMVVACVLCALLARPLIVKTFGIQFAPSVDVLLWLLPGTFFVALVSISSQYLAAIGYPRTTVWIWAAAWVLLVVVSLLLIPRWGARGAAAAQSLTYLFTLIAQLVLIRYGRAAAATDLIEVKS